MKRKILSLALCAALFSAALCTGVRATGMGEFQKQRTYSGQFSDIVGKWHETYIADLYEYGLAEGMDESTMAPDEPVTVAQVTALAVRINAKYYDGHIGEHTSGEWYEPYISYAYDYGLIKKGEFEDFDRPATRRESVLIFSRALPDWQFDAVNEEQSFGDVSSDSDWDCYMAVGLLSRAGVVNGYEDGSFRPDNGISRAEAMTIADRTVNKSQRRGYSGAQPDQPEQGGDNGGTDNTDNKWTANEASGTFVLPGLAMVNADFEKGSFTMAVSADIKGGVVSFSGVCETKVDMDGSIVVNCMIKDCAVQGGASLNVAEQAAAVTAMAFVYDGGRRLTLREAVVNGKMVNSSVDGSGKPVYVVGMLSIGATLTAAN